MDRLTSTVKCKDRSDIPASCGYVFVKWLLPIQAFRSGSRIKTAYKPVLAGLGGQIISDGYFRLARDPLVAQVTVPHLQCHNFLLP
jgi:hypothetical protein